MYIAGGIPGSCSDSNILGSCSLWNNLNAWLPAPFRLLGDAGMPLRPQLLTIIERAAHCGLDDKSVYYNSRLSNGRVLVEQAFGIGSTQVGPEPGDDLGL